MEISEITKELLLLPPADLADEVIALKEELEKERDKNLRNLADFKNYKRRVEREGNKIADDNKREIMFSLLFIMDDLENAIMSAGGLNSPLVKGVQSIYQKLKELIEVNGVFAIDCVGEQFDHNFHEAVLMSDSDEVKPGVIISELRRGYFYDNTLLRASQVNVSGA